MLVAMVFFTCGACGESLKKAQVEKHVSMCRGCETLSCIDCGQDFWGDDYRNHVRCISEDQKYGGRGYEAKANKGDVKQQQWLQKVHTALSKPDLSASLRRVLQQVAAYDNVPRKQAKFQNWMKNSLKISDTSLHQQVWGILSASAEPPQTDSAVAVEAEAPVGDNSSSERKKLNKRERKEARRQKNGLATSKTNGLTTSQTNGLETSNSQRKRKHRDETDDTEHKKTKKDEPPTDAEEPETEPAATKGKFNWKGNIKAVLRDAPDQELPLKKLRRKVLAAFYSFVADDLHKSEEEVLAIFNRKINKNPKLRVLKDRVKLIK